MSFDVGDREAGPLRFFSLTILGVGLVCQLLAVTRLVSAPVFFDESDFLEMMVETSERGSPRVPASEDLRILIPPEPSTVKYGERLGMWHPGLYIFSGAVFGSVVGITDTTVRMLGLCWTIATFLAMGFISYRLNRSCLALSILVGLFGLTPFLREGSMLVDIDNTALSALSFLFLYLFLKFEAQCDVKSTLVLSCAMAACMWAKLTMPVILLASTGLYQLSKMRPFFGFAQLVLVAIGGMILFAATYGFYCWLMAYPWFFPIDFTFIAKQSAIVGQRSLGPIIQSARWNVVWATPAVSLAIALAVGSRVVFWIKHRRTEEIDLLVFFLSFGILAYVFKAATIGKYTFPFIAAGLLVVSNQVSRFSIVRPRIFFFSACLLAAVYAAYVPNLQLKPANTGAVPSELSAILADPRVFALGLALGLAVGMAGVALWSLKAGTRFQTMLIGSLACALIVNPIDCVKGMLWGFDGRAPLRPFEEKGYWETFEFLVGRVEEGETLLIEKDMGYRLSERNGIRYIPFDSFGERESFLKIVDENAIRYVVQNDYFGALSVTIPESRIRSDQSFGNYHVLELKSPTE